MNIPNKILLKVLTLELLLTCGSVMATTYYVSPTGRDVQPVTKERPFRTIQHTADVMRPGEYMPDSWWFVYRVGAAKGSRHCNGADYLPCLRRGEGDYFRRQPRNWLGSQKRGYLYRKVGG